MSSRSVYGLTLSLLVNDTKRILNKSWCVFLNQILEEKIDNPKKTISHLKIEGTIFSHVYYFISNVHCSLCSIFGIFPALKMFIPWYISHFIYLSWCPSKNNGPEINILLFTS